MSDWHCPQCGKTLSSSASKRTCKKCGAPHCYGHSSGSKCGVTGCGGYLARTTVEDSRSWWTLVGAVERLFVRLELLLVGSSPQR